MTENGEWKKYMGEKWWEWKIRYDPAVMENAGVETSAVSASAYFSLFRVDISTWAFSAPNIYNGLITSDVAVRQCSIADLLIYMDYWA